VVMERRRLRLVQHRKRAREQLDLAARERRVHGAGRTVAHSALDGDDELRAQALGLGKHLGLVGIEDDLQQSLAVAQIDEDDAAVIAAAMNPAGDSYRLADERTIDVAAVMTAHRRILCHSKRLKVKGLMRFEEAGMLRGRL